MKFEDAVKAIARAEPEPKLPKRQTQSQGDVLNPDGTVGRIHRSLVLGALRTKREAQRRMPAFARLTMVRANRNPVLL